MTTPHPVTTLPTMADLPPPVANPGPAPIEPEFPFAEAEAAKAALATLQAELYALINTRDTAAAAMLDGASGTSIDNFRLRYDDLDGQIRGYCAHRGAALVMDMEWIAQAITEAQQAADDYEVARAAWDVQRADWQAWMDLTGNGRIPI